MDRLTCRSFVAVSLPRAVREGLARLQKPFRRSPLIRATFPDPGNFHQTLFFLGDCKTDVLDQVKTAMDDSLEGLSACQLWADTLGIFPDGRGPARVLWAGLSGQVETLHQIRARLSPCLGTLGISLDRRPFTPHITLARFKRSPSRSFLDNLILEALSSHRRAPFTLTGIDLYASQLTPSGAIYTRIYKSRITHLR